MLNQSFKIHHIGVEEAEEIDLRQKLGRDFSTVEFCISRHDDVALVLFISTDKHHEVKRLFPGDIEKRSESQ